MKIRLTGPKWGAFGTPEQGTIVEADWHGQYWAFDNDTVMAAPTGDWAAEEVEDQE